MKPDTNINRLFKTAIYTSLNLTKYTSITTWQQLQIMK
jgi:hypothetical protein